MKNINAHALLSISSTSQKILVALHDEAKKWAVYWDFWVLFYRPKNVPERKTKTNRIEHPPFFEFRLKSHINVVAADVECKAFCFIQLSGSGGVKFRCGGA